jgi:hypothetical protein
MDALTATLKEYIAYQSVMNNTFATQLQIRNERDVQEARPTDAGPDPSRPPPRRKATWYVVTSGPGMGVYSVHNAAKAAKRQARDQKLRVSIATFSTKGEAENYLQELVRLTGGTSDDSEESDTSDPVPTVRTKNKGPVPTVRTKNKGPSSLPSRPSGALPFTPVTSDKSRGTENEVLGVSLDTPAAMLTFLAPDMTQD